MTPTFAPAATGTRLHAAPRSEAGAFRRCGEPVAAGVPFAKGALEAADAAQLLDADGVPVETQVAATERWSDGSVRWLLVRFNATTDSSGRRAYRLVPGRPWPSTDVPPPAIRITDSGDAMIIRTGPIAATIADGIAVREHGGPPLPLAIAIVDSRGARLRVRFVRREIEESGALYVRVRVSAIAVTPDGRSIVDVSLRLEFFGGLPFLRCEIALTNPRRARHPGGIWQLGDPASLLIGEASVSMALPPYDARTLVRYSTVPGHRETVDADVSVHQESSGGAQWNSRNHVNRHGVVPLRYRGYELRVDDRVARGLRATPIVQIVGTTTAVAVASEHFWENFPKAIRADERAVRFDLFPADAPEPAELQPGERKTHWFTIAFGDDPVTEQPLAWVRAPLLLTAEPEAYLAAEPLPFLSAVGVDPSADALVRTNLEGPHALLQKREDVDEYGWRHFGDLYADHEAVGSPGLISHYNNQYDAIAAFAAQYFRSGDARWWTLLDDLAAHVADVDIYHTSCDKSAYSGGLFWHTSHYIDAGLSTHRSYPAHPGVNGGGPSAEHNYSTGLMLHHFLTGSPSSREAAIGLAEWVLAMDDGDGTPFKWLARGATGYASATGSFTFHGPGRGAGNSIAVLLNAHRLTGERRFLSAAERLIVRCIDPADDFGALNLLDAERRWSYTVFLQSLGRYLLHKAELGELDARYAHARASLLHYARWMTDHEYPYLDKPEILEYPNETWAAQDLRKAEVLVLGAMAAIGDERRRMIARAGDFHDRALRDLSRSGTAWLTRAAVILLSTAGAAGWWHRGGHAQSLPDALWDAGRVRGDFVPQRVRAMRRAQYAAAALAAALATCGAVYLL